MGSLIQNPQMADKISLGILAVFPAVLLLTEPVRLFKDVLYPNFDPQEWPFINSKGFLNRFLAGHSFEIFLTTFILLNIFKLWLVHNRMPILPINENNNENQEGTGYKQKLQSNKSDLNLYKQIEHMDPPTSNTCFISLQLIKLVSIYGPIIVFIVWFFGASMYDRIHHYTGGFCINHPELKYYRTCVSKGYKYTGGFKCSGHSLITSIFASCIAFETLSVNNWIVYINHLNPLPFHIYRSGHLLVLFALYIYISWLMMFTITCLFYHTFFERIIGTACGMITVFSVYIKCKL